MEQIKQYINNNNTIKLMLLNKDNTYWKEGALEQIKLDTGLSTEFVYKNYFEIINYCS
mgnify:CR=1 FL=1